MISIAIAFYNGVRPRVDRSCCVKDRLIGDMAVSSGRVGGAIVEETLLAEALFLLPSAAVQSPRRIGLILHAQLPRYPR